MTDLNLTELLERAGERTNVGPPPVQAMVAGASRRRRRRTLMLTAATAAAAVVVTVGGTSMLSIPGRNSPEQPTPAASTSPDPATPDESTTTSTDLEGTWTVRALVGADGRSVLPESARGRVRLTFTDGEMTGTWGCTTVSGRYEPGGEDGQDLRFPPEQMSSTSRDCIDERLPLVSRLLDVRRVSGSAGVRYLHAENWMIVAELRRS